jgi:predicted negative regulator of RcsB-dependent stress response
VTGYETEEQQVEALKKWWAENGKSIIGGVVLGLAILFGWKGWSEYRQAETELASAMFNQIQMAADRGIATRVSELTAELQKDFAFTPYAGHASLMDAKFKAESGDLQGALTQLEWARSQAREETVKDIAQLRLARVQLAMGNPDQALKSVESLNSVAYLSMVEEVRGDAYRAKGDIESARQAYDRAILASSGGAPRYLQMKRADLGKAGS